MEKIHLELKLGQNIFFTSDMHIGHRNILSFCNRDVVFEDTNAMNAGLVERWNKVVGPEDIVFNCGDFLWFPSKHEYAKWFKKLNGIHYIIPGNHDEVPKMMEAVDKYDLTNVYVCSDVVCLYLEGHPHQARKIQEIILCHYPLLTWSHADKQTIHLFGHIHSRAFDKMTEFDVPMQFRHNMLDCGCDAHNYTPISLEKVYEELRQLGLNQSDKNWGLQLVGTGTCPNQPEEDGQ